MGSANVSPKKLEKAIDKLISHETIRRTLRGERGLTPKEAFHIANAIGWGFEMEVGDVEEWLLSGRVSPYNPNSRTPRSINQQRLADVIPIRRGRKTHTTNLAFA